MDWIKEKYYVLLLKYEKHVDVLKDKLLEMSIKAPLWFAIQFIFWKGGGLFIDNVHFFTSVHDVFITFLPREIALLLQFASYYIILNPIMEFIIIIASEKIEKG